MEIKNQPKLQKGDTVLVSVFAGGLRGRFQAADILADALKQLDLNVIVSDLCTGVDTKMPYYPGTDEAKVEELEKAFKDENIKAIFCVRGGEGSIDLLPLIDYSILEDNPTIFVGMSDMTALQAGIVRNTNLEVYHGPVYIHFNGEGREFALQGLKDALFNDISEINLENTHSYADGNISIEGMLIGGNISVLAKLPIEYWYTNEDSILLLEDVGAYLYQIKGSLSAMNVAGKLKNVKAVVVGQNCYKKDDDFMDKGNGEFKIPANPEDLEKGLAAILDKYFSSKGIPVVTGARFGHDDDHLTLPIGRKVKLEIIDDNAKLII